MTSSETPEPRKRSFSILNKGLSWMIMAGLAILGSGLFIIIQMVVPSPEDELARLLEEGNGISELSFSSEVSKGNFEKPLLVKDRLSLRHFHSLLLKHLLPKNRPGYNKKANNQIRISFSNGEILNLHLIYDAKRKRYVNYISYKKRLFWAEEPLMKELLSYLKKSKPKTEAEKKALTDLRFGFLERATVVLEGRIQSIEYNSERETYFPFEVSINEVKITKGKNAWVQAKLKTKGGLFTFHILDPLKSFDQESRQAIGKKVIVCLKIADTISLKDSQILAPKLLLEVLIAAQAIKRTNPGKQIWKNLTQKLKEQIKKHDKKTDVPYKLLSKLVDELNTRVIASEAFFTRGAWKKGSISKEMEATIIKGLSNLSTEALYQLNRKLLSAAFPNIIAQPLEIKKGTFQARAWINDGIFIKKKKKE